MGASSAKACQACSGTEVSNAKQTKCIARQKIFNPGLIIAVSISSVIVILGLIFYGLRLRKRMGENHFYELTEQNQHTQRLLDSANNPLEQTQYLIDPSELHLGEWTVAWLLVVVCDC